MRSSMLVSPAPRIVVAGSNPVPLSSTSTWRRPSASRRRTAACVAVAYFCTFCSASSTLEQLKGDADDALETLRDLARGIYPPLLAEKGLVTALESQARKATLPVLVDADGITRYPQDLARRATRPDGGCCHEQAIEADEPSAGQSV